MVELLFWPTLVAYGEATVALVGEARRPGIAGRLAIWGVRIGWLAQTALLLAQAVTSEGFPWSSWGGALNLLAWLVVSSYLLWGCRPRFRLLGLWVMPVAACLLLLAYAGGGVAVGRDTGPGVLLTAHVAFMLAALAGFTVAAALAAFYLWHERRLKRREATILSLPVPPLAALDRLATRTVAVSLLALTAGIALGATRLAADGGEVDGVMAATAGAWLFYGGLLLARLRGARGRRPSRVTLAGFAVVVVLLLMTHFAS